MRWVGAVGVGLAYGAVTWALSHFLWHWDLELWPTLGFGVGVALFLAYLGLPIAPHVEVAPGQPQPGAFRSLWLQWRAHVSAHRMSPRAQRRWLVFQIGELAAMLVLVGTVGSIFLMGSFSSSSGAGLRLVCFGGALVCVVALCAKGGRLGQVVGAGMGALTIAAWGLLSH